MKLSFVIPAYNEELIMTKCLDSVFKEVNSSSHDIEIIVVNNASTDRTREIAMAYPGVTVIDEPKKGITWARNTGSKIARGELIANTDADVILPEGWLDRVFAEFGKDDKLVALSGPHVFRELPKLSQYNVRLFYYFGYVSHLVNFHVLKKGCMLQGGNYILKKSALENVGWYDGGPDFYEDTFIASRIHKAGNVKFTFDMPVYASSRRFKKLGLLASGAKYAINYFWILLFKKSFSEGYIDIRNNK